MKAIWYDKEILSLIRGREEDILVDTCEKIVDDIKKSMRVGTHKTYKSRKPSGGFHKSSKPGLPPAPDTEVLKNSISYQTSTGKKNNPGDISKPNADNDEIVGRIGTRVEYALWLELPTSRINLPEGQGKLEPRPFLRPGVHKNEKTPFRLVKKYKI